MKRKYLLPISVLLITMLSLAEPQKSLSDLTETDSLEEIRLTYYSGVENEEYIDSLQILIDKKFGEDTSKYSALALAYQAGVEALKSKHAFWPFTKMSYLNDSMDLFERAIKDDPDNLEIRFMRFSILYYVPGILGYDQEESEDAKVIYDLLLEKDFSRISYDIQEGMAEFIIRSDFLSEEQIQKLSNRFTLANNE